MATNTNSLSTEDLIEIEAALSLAHDNYSEQAARIMIGIENGTVSERFRAGGGHYMDRAAKVAALRDRIRLALDLKGD